MGKEEDFWYGGIDRNLYRLIAVGMGIPYSERISTGSLSRIRTEAVSELSLVREEIRQNLLATRQRSNNSIDRAKENFSFINKLLKESSKVTEYLERTNSTIDLVRGNYFFSFPNSYPRIFISSTGWGSKVMYQEGKADTDIISSSPINEPWKIDGDFFEKSWDKGYSRGLTKKFGRLAYEEIIKKIEKRVKSGG